MPIDLRLTTLDRLDEVLKLPVTTISIGHDGCPHKLPSSIELKRAADKIRTQGKHFTFVVPISYERFAKTTVERIAALIDDGPLTVVANDIGLLLTMVEHEWHQICAVAVGHGLSYSFEQQPWFDIALQQENPLVRDGFHQHNLEDPWLCSQLGTWGVTMIEVDNLPGAQESYAALSQAGFTLNMLLDFIPIAFARSCHTARYYDASPPTCTHLCNQPFKLNVTHRWRLYHNHLEPMSKQARAFVPDFTVYGNVVYRQSEVNLPIIPDPETMLTLDIRHYSPDQLTTRVIQVMDHLENN